MNINELQERLRIDRDDLDECLASQPTLVAQVGRQWSLALSERDGAKNHLKEVEAKEYARIRGVLEEEGKVTETMISQRLVLSKRVQAAKVDVIEAAQRASELETLKDAFKDRGYALKGLVDLFLASYYEKDSAGSVEASRSHHSEAMYERNRKRLAEARRARKKTDRERL